jgi:hypothetical protein
METHMYPEFQKELATFQKRTPKSAASHKRNLKRIPLGVASNYRAYDPHPIFVKEAQVLVTSGNVRITLLPPFKEAR